MTFLSYISRDVPRASVLLPWLGVVLLIGCVDQNPIGPAELPAPEDMGLTDLAPYAPDFAAGPGEALLGPCSVVADIYATPATWPLCMVSRTQTQTLIRVTFEGLPNPPAAPARPQAVPTIGYATFPSWNSLVARWAGGSGNTFHEPSGKTTLFWSLLGANRNPAPSSRNISMQRPIYSASLSYAAKLGCPSPWVPCEFTNSLSAITLKGISSTSAVLSSNDGPANYNGNPGTGETGWNADYRFNKWDVLSVTSPVVGGVPDNRIHTLNINGHEDFIGIDDLIVNIINFRPVAVAGGPYAGNQASPIQFTGSASFDPVDASGLPHPNGDAVTYVWDFGDGSPTVTTAAPQHTYLEDGDYTASLTVTDPNGLSNTATVQVAVANVTPTITARDTTALVGTALELPISFTDPGSLDSPWSYSVDWGDGTVKSGTVTTWAAIMSPAVADRTHTYSSTGTKTVVITVTDAAGGTRTKNIEVTVPNRAPVAEFASGPTSADEGDTGTFASGSTDPDGDALTHEWTATKTGSTTVLASGAGNSFDYLFPDNGSYIVTLSSSDGTTATSTQRTVAVGNVAPTATLSAPATATIGEPFTISLGTPADASSADETAGFTYSFDCGSGYGAAGTSSSASCTPAAVGSLTIKARIHDKDGDSTEYTASVTVQLAPAPPVPGTLSVPGSGSEGAQIGMSTTGWSDPNGGVISYQWAIRKDSPSATPIASPTGTQITYAFPDNGTYYVTVVGSDPGGLDASLSSQIVIDNVAPTADFSVSTGQLQVGDQFALNLANASDPSTVDTGAGFSYAFDCGTGSFATASGPSTTCTPTTDGVLTVRGQISDKDGGSTVRTGTVTVQPATPTNSSPVAGSIDGPATGVEGSTFSYSAQGWSDPDGDPLTYAWSVTGPEGFTATGTSSSFTLNRSGSYSIQLTASDGVSETAISRTITVQNAAPNVSLSTSAANLSSGETLNITGAFTDIDPDDGPWTWTLAWGDGESESGTRSGVGSIPLSRQLFVPGSYTIELTVTDREGASGTASRTVTVEAISSHITIIPWLITIVNGGTTPIHAKVWSSSGIDLSLFDPATLRLTSKEGAGAPVRKKNNGRWDYEVSASKAQFTFDSSTLAAAGDIPTTRFDRLYLVGQLKDGRWFEGWDDVLIVWVHSGAGNGNSGGSNNGNGNGNGNRGDNAPSSEGALLNRQPNAEDLRRNDVTQTRKLPN